MNEGGVGRGCDTRCHCQCHARSMSLTDEHAAVGVCRYHGYAHVCGFVWPDQVASPTVFSGLDES